MENNITEARKELLDAIKSKVPANAQSVVVDSLQGYINSLSASDCKAMAEMIRTKGLASILFGAKKIRKQKEKAGEDMTAGKEAK